MSILISILMNVCFHVINLNYSKKKYNKKEADDNIKVNIGIAYKESID